MKLTPYLSFNGQCEEAFQFYEKCLGGKILFKMTYGESPLSPGGGPEVKTPPGWGGKLMHATFAVGDQLLQGADTPSAHKLQGFAISISLSDAAEAEGIFAAFADGGSVQMPIQPTFWALRFGMVTDRFGMPWMINCEKPA
jgi:PhnB protein